MAMTKTQRRFARAHPRKADGSFKKAKTRTNPARRRRSALPRRSVRTGRFLAR